MESSASGMAVFLETPPPLEDLLETSVLSEDVGEAEEEEEGEIAEEIEREGIGKAAVVGDTVAVKEEEGQAQEEKEEALAQGEEGLGQGKEEGLAQGEEKGLAQGEEKEVAKEKGEDRQETRGDGPPSRKRARRRAGKGGVGETEQSRRNEDGQGREGAGGDLVPSDTLFFPSVPEDVGDEEMREVCSRRGVSGLVDLRLKGKATTGFNYVWATFTDSKCATEGLKRLRGVEVRPNRRLAPVFNSRKTTVGTKRPNRAVSGWKAFEEKRLRVVAAGGNADTLLIRKIPLECEEEEVEKLVKSLTSNVLRMRHSDAAALPVSMFAGADEASDAQTRKCWATYDSRHSCENAFQVLSGHKLQVDPDTTAKLHVALHDDTTDAHNPINKGRQIGAGDNLSSVSAMPCVFFRKGKCTKGESCRFPHIPDPQHGSKLEI